MAQTPVTITLTLTPGRDGSYAGQLVGWSIAAAGGYGSCWSIRLPEVGPTDATARETLRSLAVALLARVGDPL